MTDRKISELTQITGANVDDANDELAIVDASASETKAITRAELMSSVSSMSITGDLTVDTNTLYVNSVNNRVGIGTTSPLSSLHVAPASGGDAYIRLEGAELNRNNYIGVEGYDNLVLAADDSNLGTSSLMQFRVDGSERMRITSSGRVGIGTSSPARTLHVNDVMRLEPTTTPSSPSAGDIYFDSSTNKLRCYDGTAWNDLF